MQEVQSFIVDQWIGPGQNAREIADAATGEVFARAGGAQIDTAAMVDHARRLGGTALRAMSFHERAKLLKAVALHLNAHKQALYEASFATGATAKDHLFDIDGGIGTLFVYASKGRRELPDDQILTDGPLEQLGKTGSFLGQHVYTSKPGVVVQINAFNFPVWGMLEKFAPALLAGLPTIVKPATATCYVTELCVRLMLESGLLPKGALQLVTGSIGDTFQHLGMQDTVTFTGSADTAQVLRQSPEVMANGVTFMAEQDSLNAAILGPDAGVDTPEFDLFVKEAVREMTVKAGQKCTAIRRMIVPDAVVAPVIEALSERLSKVVIGDPRREGVTMGALVSAAQKQDVQAKAEKIAQEAQQVFDGATQCARDGLEAGAFVAPRLFHCADPFNATLVHDVEAFGPVATVMGYGTIDEAVALANKGQGSLVTSLITHDPKVARDVVMGAGAYHGRIYINDRTSMGESTGHGAPMPHMIHGGPGRAGGGEELGGIRAVKHLMQRSALQGSPDMLRAITGSWVPGAATIAQSQHPFTQTFHALDIGTSLRTEGRKISLDDIEHFARFTGDTFYAHMDDAAAERNPFFPGRVAHGYLLLSFAAGLFVEPNEGPVLANTGLDKLRFMKPVVAGDTIQVDLTVKSKTLRTPEYGEVRWHVRLFNQDDETVATYELLTMVAV